MQVAGLIQKILPAAAVIRRTPASSYGNTRGGRGAGEREEREAQAGEEDEAEAGWEGAPAPRAPLPGWIEGTRTRGGSGSGAAL